MDCRKSRRLMASALDQREDLASTGVLAHVAACTPCADEWTRLQAVDRLLNQARFSDAPEFFVAATMERLAHRPRVEAVPDLRWSDAGVIALGSIAAALLLAFWIRSPAAPQIDLHLVTGVVHLASGVLAAIVRAPVALVSIQMCLALAVAALWFVAVIAPRTTAMRRIV